MLPPDLINTINALTPNTLYLIMGIMPLILIWSVLLSHEKTNGSTALKDKPEEASKEAGTEVEKEKEPAEGQPVEAVILSTILQAEDSTEDMKKRAEELLPLFEKPSKEEQLIASNQLEYDLHLKTIEGIAQGKRKQ